jgi:DNA segregation ATPase FtsK/SpoIIIE, S-DNA-T family
VKLRVAVVRPGGEQDDLSLTVDATTTVGEVAAAIERTDPRRKGSAVAARLTLSVYSSGSPVTVAPDTKVVSSPVRSGSTIAVAQASASYADARASRPAAGVLTVIAGPDAGKTFPLLAGTNILGRDRECDVRLTDPMVSKHHAKVNLTDVVEIIDANSSNGILMGGSLVPRAVVRSEDTILVGDTTVQIAMHTSNGAATRADTSTIAFNRSPRLAPRYPGTEIPAPQPPQPPQRGRIPFVPLIAPVFMGGILFAITKSAASVAFVALSPLMMIGNVIEQRMAGKKAFKLATADFREQLGDVADQLEQAQFIERAQRREQHPSTRDVLMAVRSLTPLLWTRRIEHDEFAELRLGLGVQPSLTRLGMPSARNTTKELWDELTVVASRFATISDVPVVGRSNECGAIGISGPELSALSVAQGLVTQLVGLHSPAELVVAAFCSTHSSTLWGDLKWLPHCASDHSPLEGEHLTSSPGGCLSLVSRLEELADERAVNKRSGDDPPPVPAVIVLVTDDAPADRSRLVSLAERGRGAGIYVVWVSPSTERLPAVCRVFIQLDANSGGGMAGFVHDGSHVTPLALEPVTRDEFARFCRALAPVVDSCVPIDDESDLPRSVSYLSIAGSDLAETPSAVLDRWRESNSIIARDGSPPVRRRHANTLRALVGQGGEENFFLDLRTQGPHALVGGTTGAGKSEFLQSWILGMAGGHSPDRVTFLFVDYKGGAAFRECVTLPHCVGLVTDLSPHLVRRALTSLNAELRHREHLLNRKRVKDLLELERTGDPECPPSLVIVVDEFAALVSEVPEFVDGVVNVAQRGRSLGLHLILATQRPAGVIKDNLRANTNLRVALRMADEADSTDVIGTQHAATFDPAIPGRAMAKTGPGRLTAFQAGYVGGWTSNEPPKSQMVVHELPFAVGALREEGVDEGPVIDDLGPNDMQRLVSMINAASEQARIPLPRKPWLPELAPCYDLAGLPTARTDSDLVYGVVDDPEAQSQPTVSFVPDMDGNMAVFGTGGSGKSTFLRSLAVAAGLSVRGGPCFVYGIDAGSRGLQMLEVLPHVGAIISGDDHERIARLIRMLRATVDDRALAYARVGAGSVEQYRRLATKPEEARILVLIDGFGAFRQNYEVGERSRLFDMLTAVAADGRGVGVHMVISADRPGAVPSVLNSAIQRRLVLRLSNEMDLQVLGAPDDGFSDSSPPGRAFLDGSELQVAVLGGATSVSEQGHHVAKLVDSMQRAKVVAAPGIERLTERVALSELPTEVEAMPVLGIADESLGPIGFPVGGPFLVSGPPGSGRTSTLAALSQSIKRWRPESRLVYFGSKRSPLGSMLPWDASALTPDDVATLAGDLTEKMQADEAESHGLVLVVENIPDFLNGPADYVLQELLRVARTLDVPVLIDGENSGLNGSWPLLQAAKAGRQGLALQPDQMDGDSIFRTSFPRLTRTEFPPGRALFVRNGRAVKVQVAMPE